jgi:YVTN family beta-propeller protein
MRFFFAWRRFCSLGFSLVAMLLLLHALGCSGGSSGGGADVASDTTGVFNKRNVNLYQEVPAIEIEGNNIRRNNPGVDNQSPDDPTGEQVYWENRNFNPQTSRESELVDTDGDGIPDTQVNDFDSIVNAANRLLDFDLAACIIEIIRNPLDPLYIDYTDPTTYPDNGEKHLGYLDPSVWVDNWIQRQGTSKYDYQPPDTMPVTADNTGTRGTQYIQLIIPFQLFRGSIFFNKGEDVTVTLVDDTEVVLINAIQRRKLDYLDPYKLTFQNEDWDESLLPSLESFDHLTENLQAQGKSDTVILNYQQDWVAEYQIAMNKLVNSHVPCTVLVDGVDRAGFGPGSDKDDNATHDYDTNWDELRGVDIDPKGRSSIVFIAQPDTGLYGVPSEQPFTLWADGKLEIRPHFIECTDKFGKTVEVRSKWYVLRGNPGNQAPAPPKVVKIEATDPVRDNLGNVILDWDDPTQTTPPNDVTMDPGDPKTVPLVHRSTNFIIHFDKPVIPETVGQSIVFKGKPFAGNIEPVVSNLTIFPPDPGDNPCARQGTYIDPLAPNVAIASTLYLDDGTATNVEGTIPFRVHPLHQNNLSVYVLNPLIELPGSPDLGSIPLDAQDGAGAGQNEYTRLRVDVKVYRPNSNYLTGRPSSNGLNPDYDPANALSGPQIVPFPPLNMGITGYFGERGEVVEEESSRQFTLNSGGRYVNAPVSPHALYYTMGPKGMGIVDLDGNGFTTNAPNFSKEALVTSQRFYSRWGNAGKGVANNYSYGAKATGGQPYIGLGAETPVPGINAGSTGIDEVVRDSNGNAVLFPDPSSDIKFSNISDVELGDFLDTIYFDKGNEWALTSFHLSAVNQTATGSYYNNLISTPPTPNPPPLSLPIGMRPTAVILDEFSILDEGALVIPGKEVFTVDLVGLSVGFAPNTGFVHLNPAILAGSSTDEPFPPNRSSWVGGTPDYMNLGPVADSSTIGLGWYYGSRQQIGNFLFVADKSNNQVNVVNSNTMEIITSLTGLSGPDSVAVTPDMRTLFVTNSGGQAVSIFRVNPRSDDFLNQIGTIFVGSQPKGICCQPDGEDVFVCNFASNTISVLNPTTLSVRKTLSALLKGPWDMVAGPRQSTFGFGGQVFHAYISNHKANNVLIYESGPSGFGGVGYDDILDPVPETGQNGQQFLPIDSPRGITWDPSAGLQYPLSGGAYVAHTAGSYGVVSRIEYVAQQAPYGPIFLIPNSGAIGGTPGFGKRVFTITAQWGGPDNPLSGKVATDVALLDYNRNAWLNDNWLGNFFNVTNIGDYSGPFPYLPINNKSPIRTLLQGSQAFNQTFNPDRMFVSFDNTPVIDVVNPTSSQIVKTITGLPRGAKKLKTYFKF